MQHAERKLSGLDRLLADIGNGLATVFGGHHGLDADAPGASLPEPELSESEKKHAAGLMRINHAGEICAQALYLGQAWLCRTPELREHLLAAAKDEKKHLAWCAQRLTELDSHASRLNALWYAGSFAIGAAAGFFGNEYSLGFVVETENQVESHLGEHLRELPAVDARSKAILSQMQADEMLHAQNATMRGARALPAPVPTLMRYAALAMKKITYRI